MKVLVAGGSGFIGQHLCRTLINHKHEVTVFSRNPDAIRAKLTLPLRIEKWNGLTWGALENILEGQEAVVNLAGEPIANGRWTHSKKQLLFNSRIDTTRRLVEAMSRTSTRPEVLVNASGIGFYGPQEGNQVEETSPSGGGFLADLCEHWEKEAQRAEQHGLRVIRLRIGMVLGRGGGALPKMLLPFRFFLGGPVASGQQMVSWIHQEDLSRLIVWLLDQRHISGPVNAVAPEAVIMKQFCKTLGQVIGRPSWLPVPELALKLGLGELATMMTTGQDVNPLVAKREGFPFTYPTLKLALESLFKKNT